jgi:hypothetical protein
VRNCNVYDEQALGPGPLASEVAVAPCVSGGLIWIGCLELVAQTGLDPLNLLVSRTDRIRDLPDEVRQSQTAR